MKTFYDFIRRTSGKLNEAAGDEYDLTKEEDIFFTSTIAEDGNKYYQLKKLKNGKLTTSAIVDIGVKDAALGIYYVLTYSGSKYLFDVHNLDEDSGIDGKPPIGSRLNLMWKEIKDVAKQQQQQQTPEPAAPNQQQPQQRLTIEQYKELIKHIMRQKGIFELSMQKAIDEINNPTHEEIKNMPENDKKEFIEFVSTATSYKSQIERKIDKLEDNVISYFGPFIVAAVNSQNMDHVASFCCTILMMALGQIKEQQEKQQQQEDSQEHLLALARQLKNPKIRKGLVYMINGAPGRVSVWAAEIKTPEDLQKKYEDWVRRGLIE